MAINQLWVEKFRPSTLNGYVFRDHKQKTQIEEWIKQGSIPNCLFSGSPGTGKTTLARVLCNELDINPLDILELNASKTNSIDDVRDKIVSFIQMIPFGDFKVVLLDECDFLSISAQAALRGLFEEYHNTARFILTCNVKSRVIPALHSRCQGFHIETLDLTEFTARAATILLDENITFDLDILDTFVKATYPDLRKCINMLQMNSIGGILQLPDKGDNSTADYKVSMVELFKNGKITEARKLICSQARPEEIQDIYTWMYQNINLFGDTEQKQENAILIIRQGLIDHTTCADSEINLAGTLIRLARNSE